MKKLLFAIAGAASFAALAADPAVGDNITVLGFENFQTTDVGVVNKDDSGGNDTSYWSVPAGAEDNSLVKAYGVGENATAPTGISFPAPFTDAGNNYLALDTNGSELQRAIPAAGQTIGASGTYVDTLVQFTPSESAPGEGDLTGAKLAIWLGVENNVTNLYVQGNLYDVGGEGFDAVATNFVLQAASGTKEIQPGTWYRLTVKAIPNVLSGISTIPAFMISVDGVEMVATTAPFSADFVSAANGMEALSSDMATAIAANKLIPSLEAASEFGTSVTLTAVGFKGTGAIDDFVVTETAPEFAPSAISLTLTWTAAEVTAVSYVLESDPATTNAVTSGTAVSIPAAAIGTNVTLIATFESGYEFDYLDIGGYHLESLTFPVPPISTNATLVAKAAAAYPTYVGEDAALKSQYDTWKATNGADSQSAYEKQFLLNVAPGTTVADDALVIESITENETAGWDIVVSTSVSGAALSDGSDTTYNGYLLVKSANDLAGLATATPVAYTVNAVTGGKVSITVTAGKFMKVVLTTTAPAQN